MWKITSNDRIMQKIAPLPSFMHRKMKKEKIFSEHANEYIYFSALFVPMRE